MVHKYEVYQTKFSESNFKIHFAKSICINIIIICFLRKLQKKNVKKSCSCTPQSCVPQPQCHEDVRVLAPHRCYQRMLQNRIPTCRTEQRKKYINFMQFCFFCFKNIIFSKILIQNTFYFKKKKIIQIQAPLKNNVQQNFLCFLLNFNIFLFYFFILD